MFLCFIRNIKQFRNRRKQGKTFLDLIFKEKKSNILLKILMMEY